jgi:hypothetical protein
MKKIPLILVCLCLIASPVFAFSSAIQAVIGASSAPAASLCVDGTHDSGNNAILLCEDYPGTGTNSCDGSNNGGSLAWTKSGTGGADCTVTGLKTEGAKALQLDGTSNTVAVYASFAATDPVYVMHMLKWPALPGSTKTIMALSSSSTARFYSQITSGGNLVVNHGTANNTSVSSMSANTNQYLWYHYDAGTGADGVAWACFTSDRTAPSITACSSVPNNCACVTTGSSTQTVNQVYMSFSSTAANNVQLFDRIRISASPIGSNPP